MAAPGEVSDGRSSHHEMQKTTTAQPNALHLKHRQSGAVSLATNPQDAEQMSQELYRVICVALYGSGFDAIKAQALESFRGSVEEYMMHFAHKVQRSMQFCRRTQPIPQDFVYALSQSSLSPAALLAEHDLHIHRNVTQAPIIRQSPIKTPPVFDNVPFVGPQTKISERRRTYVPKHFPSFPSEHAYQDTPVYAARETDALKIREKAMEEGQLAEHALRKLMAAKKETSKAGTVSSRRRPGDVHARSAQLFDAALADLDAEDTENTASGPQGPAAAVDGDSAGQIAAVNYDRRYWRRGQNS